MELKSEAEEAQEVKEDSSNRTFMELKLSNTAFATSMLIVLIVPLWN